MGKSAARVTKPQVPPPPLRDGDRLNGREFMRRYLASPEGFRAELINGVVYVNRWVAPGPQGKEQLMPPISGSDHGRPQGNITTVCGVYAAATPGVQALAPTTLILSPTDSTTEPDALLQILPEHGGMTSLGADDFLHGPPELVVEVARSSAHRDLGPKFEMYERHGVQEYIVWRTQDRILEWFRLNRNRRYTPLAPDDDGILRSRVFPGLWVHVEALLAGEMARVLEILHQGLASPAHQSFVDKLRKAANRKKRT